jgi:hypothetical protein
MSRSFFSQRLRLRLVLDVLLVDSERCVCGVSLPGRGGASSA